jgi:NAD(P)-dependent dehydrogenase (short-subunit alcohol dehydrogenase family)
MDDGGSILVVGSSRGIGLELVRQYAASGWDVHATSRAPEEPGELGRIEGAIQLHRLDVVNRDHIAELAAALPYHGLNVIVHNAGIYRGHTREEMMQVNGRAPIEVVQALIDHERIAPRSRIVLITSQMGARRGRQESLGDYGDSKAALNDEFRLRQTAWAAAGAVAIVMHPGWVRTDMGGSGATLSVEESVTGIRRVITGLSSGDHGRFFCWDGSEHPW